MFWGPKAQVALQIQKNLTEIFDIELKAVIGIEWKTTTDVKTGFLEQGAVQGDDVGPAVCWSTGKTICQKEKERIKTTGNPRSKLYFLL